MDFKPMIIGKSNQISNTEEGHHQVSGQVRSYTCTFCEKGFSNAQALGGHMNIHRKERAKLKESSGDQTLIIPNKNPSDHLHPLADDDSSILESSEEVKSCNLKRPLVFSKDNEDGDEVSRDKEGDGEPRQLCLFVETPSSSKNDLVEDNKGLSHGSSHTGLDLELRLGLEYHET